MCDNNRDPFIATLHNVLLAADLCDRLSLIITLINSGHTFFLHRGVSLTADRRQRAEEAGAEVEALVGSDPPLIQEAWHRIKR